MTEKKEELQKGINTLEDYIKWVDNNFPAGTYPNTEVPNAIRVLLSNYKEIKPNRRPPLVIKHNEDDIFTVTEIKKFQMENLKKRRGRIRIGQYLILDKPDEKYLSILFSVFFPIMIDFNFDHLTYAGYSPYFRIIEEGNEIPFYDVLFTKDEANPNLPYTVTFKEISK